jgi:hypothetical protein
MGPRYTLELCRAPRWVAPQGRAPSDTHSGLRSLSGADGITAASSAYVSSAFDPLGPPAGGLVFMTRTTQPSWQGVAALPPRTRSRVAQPCLPERA